VFRYNRVIKLAPGMLVPNCRLCLAAYVSYKVFATVKLIAISDVGPTVLTTKLRDYIAVEMLVAPFQN